MHIVAALVLESLDNGLDIVEIRESHMANTDNVINVFKILIGLSPHLTLEVIDALHGVGAFIAATLAILLEVGWSFSLIEHFASLVHLLLGDGEVGPSRCEFLLQLSVVSLLELKGIKQFFDLFVFADHALFHLFLFAVENLLCS